jgi:hypothetical protein
MKEINIDGIWYRVTKTQCIRQGWTDVFVSQEGQPDNAACHRLPTAWIVRPDRPSIMTGGHKYSTNTTKKKWKYKGE